MQRTANISGNTTENCQHIRKYSIKHISPIQIDASPSNIGKVCFSKYQNKETLSADSIKGLKFITQGQRQLFINPSRNSPIRTLTAYQQAKTTKRYSTIKTQNAIKKLSSFSGKGDPSESENEATETKYKVQKDLTGVAATGRRPPPFRFLIHHIASFLFICQHRSHRLGSRVPHFPFPFPNL